ncbi:cytochrome c [Telluria mixta]|uniref:Cytochrome c n=1 Tax=Telluria mixta TaxID=34071 RepID=A0ABT2BUZ8_9BURK|nr:cytochrome c [Telluria mixta]MCS0628881.1 cytochrome c [Telluria mixta]
MPATRTRLIMMTVIATLLGSGTVAALGGFIVLRAGWYDIGATTQHFPFIYSMLEQGMHYSVRRHAKSVAEPALGNHEQVLRGAIVYRDNCAQCHGGPGTAPAKHGLSMQPVPGPLVDATRHWKPREVYWITRHGIKMSGMPGWEYHLSEDELWASVAFIMQLPTLSADDYRTMTAEAKK